MIRTYEELTLNAWPTLQTLVYDGWLLRFADGFTRRSNSINPLYASQKPLGEKLAYCEGMYRARGLPVVFKMTPDSQPAGLDAHLAGLGYQRDALTSVQQLELDRVDFKFSDDVVFNSQPDDHWREAYCRLAGINDARRLVHKQILNKIIPFTSYAAIAVDGEIAACGLGVLQGGTIGLYEIITERRYRQRGLGETIVTSLLSWAKEQGAHTAYLQVMVDNPPALNLYAKLGFEQVYRYWYRMLH